MEKTNIDSLNERISFYCEIFQICEDKVEGLFLLKKILLLMEKQKENDPRIQKFFKRIEDEIDLTKLDAENYYILCKEIDNNPHPLSYFLDKEEYLREKDIMGIDIKRSKAMSCWEYLCKEAYLVFEKYFKYYQLDVLMA